MEMPLFLRTLIAILGICLANEPVDAARKGGTGSRAHLSKAGRAAVLPNGGAIGLQILMGRGDKIDFFKSYGRLSPDSTKPVDSDTMFCIGSCSKPLSSVAMLRATDAGKLQLNQPIDRWLPAFTDTKVKGGSAVAAPTLYDLLCHRGGLYSQKIKLEPGQGKLLYSFAHTLEYAVNEMAKYDYLWKPGTKYAYSGAGYCVAGRAAEVALDMEFDQILQAQLCRPLGMSRTTYFPRRVDANIAVGASRRQGKLVPIPSAPHRSKPHKMQLVGGSLYSTAEDLARFARMIAQRGATDEGRFISAERWSDMVRLRGRDSKYGLGWSVKREGNEIIKLSHNGSLAQYGAILTVHLPTKSYLVYLTTLAPGNATGAKKGKSKSKVGQVANSYFQRFIQDQ